MFLVRRPSRLTIDRFLRESAGLPLSYAPVGILEGPTRDRVDEQVVAIGRGRGDFARAKAALTAWKQFDLDWISVCPEDAPIAVGTVVAVRIRHLGFWSLNGARVIYQTSGSDGKTRFGYAYGTLTNHAERGEEIFEVFIEPRTDDVKYRIRAMSWPRAMLARAGHPIVRLLQARFRRESAEALRRAVRDT
jgi:uncharacterized protein (UPF0548 family)